MLETEAELDALQQLLDRSRSGATEHLRGIIDDQRALSARDIAALLQKMKVLSLATVTARCEPRISAVDGHFLHGTWTFSTDGSAAKARHLAVRSAVSVAHIDNEELAVFAHGTAERLLPSGPFWDETLAHWTAHYGSSPLEWGEDIRVYRLRPTWMVGFASDREKLLAARGAKENRSVPADTVLPHVTYRNVAEASAWLTNVFGFAEHYRYGPPDAPGGVQMYLGTAWVMLEAADPGEKAPAELGYGTQSLTVFVPDVDAHYEKAKSAGATIVEELHETMYGERQYGARDLDGHHWLFSTHARDVSPADWGATITTQPA
jgi:uncharacterized glyoxalase superfamily protein PhnB